MSAGYDSSDLQSDDHRFYPICDLDYVPWLPENTVRQLFLDIWVSAVINAALVCQKNDLDYIV
jgi:hypothetical protein